MSNITRFDAVVSLVGGALTGNDEADKGVINYLDDQTPPTESAIDAEVKRLQAEYDAKEYQRDRLYPDMREQLDLLFHDMTAGKGDKTGEWYKAVKKVKDDTPKS